LAKKKKKCKVTPEKMATKKKKKRIKADNLIKRKRYNGRKTEKVTGDGGGLQKSRCFEF